MTNPPAWAADDGPPRVLMLGAGNRPDLIERAEQITAVVGQHAEIVLTDFEQLQDLSGLEADFAVVIGGDGSILRAARQLHAQQIPVLGVNLGRLGYLAPLAPEDLPQVFPEVCRGKCQIIEHLMFQCSVRRNGQPLKSVLGLNETAIHGGPPYKILDVDLYVDGDLATTYSCDGLIISTPVGSTAHGLSAGGPILRRDLQVFEILPISPHTLTVRPVVDSAHRVYEAAVRNPNDETSVVVDGQLICRLTEADRVRVEQAACSFLMIEAGEQNYYRTLREKLGWGGTIRSRFP